MDPEQAQAIQQLQKQFQKQNKKKQMKEKNKKQPEKYQRTKETQHKIKPEFLTVNPFKFVKKYKYKFDTYCKKRWRGLKLVDVLTKEFSSFSQQYYIQAVEAGNITINKQKVDKDYVFQPSDFMEHYTIRLEPPVLNILPEIIYEDDKLLIVNKPPSMLCHPGAGSNFNTLQGLLIHELNQPENIIFINRLDKYTSGLVLLSKVKFDSVNYHLQGIEEKEKKYLARVFGNFPDSDDQNQEYIKVDKAIYCDDNKLFHFGTCEPEDEEKLQAKKSETHFKKIWYDEKSNTSLVECIPLTGRTHQIRVHLSSIGYPILNDLHYGGKYVGNLIVNHFWPEVYQNKDFNTIKYTDADPESLKEFDEFDKVQKSQELTEEQIKHQLQLKSVLQGLKTQSDIMNDYRKQCEEANISNQNLKRQKLEENEENKNQQNQKPQENENNIQNNQVNKKVAEKIEEKNQISVDKINQQNAENGQKLQEQQLQKNENINNNNNINNDNNNTVQSQEITQDTDRKNDDIQWSFRDHVLELYLHSYQYRVGDKNFKTSLPYWADKDLQFLEGFK
ncbi:Pseudouridine synthase, catalytic domain [Pseudocohnilembus persalinus]|uniref:Pseudouridine synthase, catalytic domain n=1 Tax=Pseudocohnilembus persalinus TaxID=266149 RepID=A0A0V0QG65_PSEPJ|nr:Pseudouridine synthase, catalytic domain [Pseudocohnilembus persalinus]|eukprot:KRX01204.1 Pseudouridine synthase, catalytic domain [Pseudocohnilembus persalinus]